MQFTRRSRLPPRTGRAGERAQRLAPALAVVLALCGLTALGWIGADTRSALHESVRRALRIAELRGTITYLDELLTMSARMASLSGDRRWAERYDEAEPRLDAAITEAVSLATPAVALELERTTNEANRRLVELERAAFAHVAAGELAQARALLEGREYDQLKAVYAGGIDTFGRDLEELAAAQTGNLHRRSWLEVVGLLLGGGVFLAAAAVATRGYGRLRVALVQTEAVVRRDALTGLPNRVGLRECMERGLREQRRSGDGLALLYLDLDGFKAVNDLLGHPVGDELLCAVSSRLRASLRENDLVARLGGDEFAVVQPGPQDPGEAGALAARLVATLREPFDLRGHRVAIGASIGVALADGSYSPDALLRDADIALYKAKAEGRGTWRLFTRDMEAQVVARRTLEADLRVALAAEQFDVFYQPLVEADATELTGFEALLRWRHPDRGMVPPADFIPVAEEIGLITEIGAWVLERACTAAAAWPDHLSIAVNLSPAQFSRGDVVRDVECALATSGLRPGRLELEITESVLLGDDEATLAALHRLRALGTRISMDDFGTGYSSLSYLRMFPFDKLKIDQSFIRSIGEQRGGIEIVRAMVSLGQALGIKVLVEGVETVEHLRLMQAEHCDELQGYLFGKPGPLAAVGGVIASHALESSQVA